MLHFSLFHINFLLVQNIIIKTTSTFVNRQGIVFVWLHLWVCLLVCDFVTMFVTCKITSKQ